MMRDNLGRQFVHDVLWYDGMINAIIFKTFYINNFIPLTTEKFLCFRYVYIDAFLHIPLQTR